MPPPPWCSWLVQHGRLTEPMLATWIGLKPEKLPEGVTPLDSIQKGLTFKDLQTMEAPEDPPTFEEWVRCVRKGWQDDDTVSGGWRVEGVCAA